MNRNKIFIFGFVFIILILGIFLMKSQGKRLPQKLNSNNSSTTQTTEGAPVITEGAKEQMKQESYTNGIKLQIIEPLPNTTVSSSTLTIKGKTSSGAEVFVNDKQLKSDATGNFATKITLDEGENPIVVVANDADGNSAEQQILVTYQK